MSNILFPNVWRGASILFDGGRHFPPPVFPSGKTNFRDSAERAPFYEEKEYVFPPPGKHCRRLPLVPSHYMPPLKIEPEPAVEALDLRICKQNESISQCDFSQDILGEERQHQESLCHDEKALQHKRTPSPLPPPSSLAASMSFNPQPFMEPFRLRAPPPLRPDFAQSLTSPFTLPVIKPPSPSFSSEDQLQNLSPLERMKLIGINQQRFRERNSVSTSNSVSSLKRHRERDDSDSMDSKIRRIEDLSSETKNLIVLPSRTDVITSFQHRHQQQQRSRSPNINENNTLANSSTRQIRLKRRPSNDMSFIPNRSSRKDRSSSPNSSSYNVLKLEKESRSFSLPTPPRLSEEEVPEVRADQTKRFQGKRGRPRKHDTKVPLPPLYVFIRNLIYNEAYNPRVISWVNERAGIFKVNQTAEFAQTWGKMKRNRSEEMNYEKMSRAMRYHYGNEKKGRKGHLAMVKEKRLVYQFGELAINWKAHEIPHSKCDQHMLCKGYFCLWSKE